MWLARFQNGAGSDWATLHLAILPVAAFALMAVAIVSLLRLHELCDMQSIAASCQYLASHLIRMSVVVWSRPIFDSAMLGLLACKCSSESYVADSLLVDYLGPHPYAKTQQSDL